MSSERGLAEIDALVPLHRMFGYSTDLRSLTQGRGLHRARFANYEAMPRHVQDKVVADAEELAEA